MISSCRICGSKELKLAYSIGHDMQFKYYRCKECALINYDLDGGLNQAKYALEFVDPDNDLHKKNKHQDNSFRALKSYCKKNVDFLEIGCGNGRILQLAKKHGCNVTGLELSGYLAQSVSEKLDVPVIVADFLSWDHQERQFDIVVLRHVLEHLPDPLLALNRINTLLKKDGIVFIEVPDIDGFEFLFKRLLSRLGLHKKKYQPTFIPGHCNEFDRKSFKKLLEKTGFKFKAWENYSNRAFFDPIFKILPIGCKARGIGQKL